MSYFSVSVGVSMIVKAQTVIKTNEMFLPGRLALLLFMRSIAPFEIFSRLSVTKLRLLGCLIYIHYVLDP
jgi:hypothetical protein